MALITCPDCGNQISDAAAACLHCGRPLGADLNGQPAAGSANAIKKGIQRSKLRRDSGNALALIGLPIALVIGMATSATAGWIVALLVVGLAIWVAYGS